MSGPKRQPAELKKLKGNPGDRPLNENEPKPDIAIPDPPKHLSKIGLVEWNRIAPLLYAQRLVTKQDMAALSAYCEAYAMWVEAKNDIQKNGMLFETKNGYQQQRPSVGIVNTAMDKMHKFITEFGMTPASRAKLEVPQEAPRDEMGDFINRSKTKTKPPKNVVKIRNGTNG